MFRSACLLTWLLWLPGCAPAAGPPGPWPRKPEPVPRVDATYRTPLEREHGSRLVQVRPNLRLNVIDLHPRRKKTLILVHGDVSTFDFFRPQVAHFAKRYRVVLYERADCGRSAASPFWATYSNSADNIARLVRRLGIGEHVIIGHSRGQQIAAVYLARNPAGLRGLVAEGARIFVRPDPAQQKQARALVARHRSGQIDLRLTCLHRLRQYRRLIARGAGLSGRQTNRLIGYICARWKPSAGIMGQTDVDITAALRRVEIPVLQIDGIAYRPLLDRRKTMQRYFRNGRLRMIPGAGHVVHLERPALFNRLVDGFLREIGFTG